MSISLTTVPGTTIEFTIVSGLKVGLELGAKCGRAVLKVGNALDCEGCDDGL